MDLCWYRQYRNIDVFYFIYRTINSQYENNCIGNTFYFFKFAYVIQITNSKILV